MFKNSDNSKRAPRRNRSPSLNHCIFVLLLAIALGAAGQTTQAFATSADQQIKDTSSTYNMDAYLRSGAMCVGHEYPVKVRIAGVQDVWTQGQSVDSGHFERKDVGQSGIKVEASTKDSNIGTVSPPKLITGWAVENDSPGETTFTFAAKKAGKTDLYFEALLPGDSDPANRYLSVTKTAQVVNCKFKVSISSYWTASYPNYHVMIYADTEGEMTANADGILTGTATVSWWMAAFSQKCAHTDTISTTHAQLTGDVDDYGNATVHIAYDPATVHDVSCASSPNTTIQVPPIDVNVPPGGGVRTKSVEFSAGELVLPGSASISVVPIENK